jgi:hypothetical protein
MKLKRKHGCQMPMAKFVWGWQYCGLTGGVRKIKVKGHDPLWLCKTHAHQFKRAHRKAKTAPPPVNETN